MQVSCLRFEVLNIDASRRGEISADLLLDNTGVVLHGVRMFDTPDGSVEIDALPTGVAFATPFYQKAFTMMAVQAVVRVKVEHEMSQKQRMAAIADAAMATTGLSGLVN